MEDARHIINKFLDPDDYEKLSLAIGSGFESCHELMKRTPALGNFQTGIPQWSHLVRSFVEYGISKADITGMTHEFKPNTVKNSWHARFHKKNAAWTAHFIGGGSNKRSSARKAIYKSELMMRTLPLFPEESTQQDLDIESVYFQVLHAGYSRIPESITLAIPSKDQSSIQAITSLEIIKPSHAMVEEVTEEMHIQLVGVENEDASNN